MVVGGVGAGAVGDSMKGKIRIDNDVITLHENKMGSATEKIVSLCFLPSRDRTP
jgi:hypothetical protein